MIEINITASGGGLSERDEILRMLWRVHKRAGAAIEAISRKRSWRPSEKAMATADHIRDKEAARLLLIALGENPIG